MFSKTQAFYDAIYAFKDYGRESDVIHEAATRHGNSSGSLLDVACGTGKHLENLKTWYTVEGLDLDEGLLHIAAQRLPGIKLHTADFTDFDLRKTFDVVTCLFSAIGYAHTKEQLHAAIRSMAKHVKPHGVLLVEPWFQPDEWFEGKPHMGTVDLPDLKIARANVSERDGRLSICNMHYLIATPAGVETLEERHVLGLFTHTEVEDAFTEAGLAFSFESPGPMGRGLFVGAPR